MKCNYFITLSNFLTDEDGSFLKVSAAIMVIFDFTNIGTSSSFVYSKISRNINTAIETIV